MGSFRLLYDRMSYMIRREYGRMRIYGYQTGYLIPEEYHERKIYLTGFHTNAELPHVRSESW